ncbi:MAG: lysophospholipid acyltransferase family protein, partial [Saonia sp.]
VINSSLQSKGYAVYQKIGNTYFDALIRRIRGQWNNTPITQQEMVKTVIRNHQNNINGVYGVVSDQSPQVSRAQYWSKFMGIKVPIHNGADILARKLDLAVVFLKTTKVKRGYYEVEFIPITTSGKATKKNEIIDQFLRETEKQIRERPELYLWTHKRWKHRDKVPEKFK